jgi:hypothetical protein
MYFKMLTFIKIPQQIQLRDVIFVQSIGVQPSRGTVALYGSLVLLFLLADHRATDFTLSKICGTASRIRRTFQQ